MTVDLTDSNFDDLMEAHEFVLLDFWADWCGPCHSFAPFYEEASERHPEVLFGKINTVLEEKLAKEFAIFSVPTLLAVRDGTIVYARPGAISPYDLEKLAGDLKSGRLKA